MRSFRNNNKRSRYRSNGDRNFKRNGESHSYAGNTNFQRRSPGRNNQNASQLIEKYTDLAREALSNGDVIEKLGLKQVTDTGALEEMCDAIMNANQEKVEQYRGGKEKLFGFFVGQVMKASKGSANPQVVNEILKAKLG